MNIQVEHLKGPQPHPTHRHCAATAGTAHPQWPGCHHGRDQRSWRRHDISHCHLLPGCNPHFAAGRGHVQLQKSMVNMTASALSHHKAIFPSMLMLSVSLCMRRLHVHRADTGDLIDEPHKLPPPIVVGRAHQSWVSLQCRGSCDREHCNRCNCRPCRGI